MPLPIGIHDAEGAHLLPPGAWCVALVYLSENSTPRDYHAIRSDINWLVRVNWGPGSSGTIPKLDQMNSYLEALTRFVGGSKGVHTYIIGNEPNHEQERPDGVFITPSHYAHFYNQAYVQIKRLSNNNRITHAAPAPYHASPTSWLEWTRQMFHEIRHFKPDSLNCHAYLRGAEPSAVSDESRMGGVLGDSYNGFLTYLDFMACVPPDWRGLPLDITECNEILNDGWLNQNTGVIKALYRHVRGVIHPRIRSLSLYRYPKYDKWHIEGKEGVIQDFREAISEASVSPVEGQGEVLHLPQVQSSTPKPPVQPEPSTSFKRDVDRRAVARGVKHSELAPNTQGLGWRVKKIRWYDSEEAKTLGPDHHILVDTVDESGNRIVGVPVRFVWPSGNHLVKTEAKPGERWSANLPMSPSRNEFSVFIHDGLPSESVTGIGMGEDTPRGFNAGHHTSTEVVFQRVVKGETPFINPPEKKTPPKEDIPMPENPDFSPIYPFRPGVKRVITQAFGVNKEVYQHLNYDGVPLKGHNGVDFYVPVGTDILASDSGKAVEVSWDPDGYGNYVKLVHIWGETLYAHLNKVYVSQGDVVKKGQLLGLSGATGWATGPHLHFAMRVHPYSRKDGFGGYIDPIPHLDRGMNVKPPPTPTRPQPRMVVDVIKQAARESGLDWRLLSSLAWAESSFNPDIPDGLFQVEDDAWNDFAPVVGANDRTNALDNARVGAAYLKHLLKYFNQNLEKALIAYNFGIGRVIAGEEPPRLTLEYVNKVNHGYDLLKAVGV